MKELTDDELDAFKAEDTKQKKNIKLMQVQLGNIKRTYDAWQVATVAKVSGEDPDDIQIGSWECGASPINVCAYGIEGDDFCLFCGGPDERK